MNDSGEPASTAWQPFTFSGVAAFASARFRRVFSVGLAFALAWGAVVAWFLVIAYQPAIEEALTNLPAQGQIAGGQLDWHGRSPTILGQRPFFAVVVDPDGSGKFGQLADVQAVFGRTHLRIESLLGYWILPYASGWSVPFNQTELEPWWGAWHPFLVAGSGCLAALLLELGWALIAVVYTLPVCVIALVWRRPMNLLQGFRLAWAALLPGSLIMILALAAYGLQRLSLVGLLSAFGVHFVVGWIYLLFAPARAGSATAATVSPQANPFGGPKATPEAKAQPRRRNPFST